MTKIWNVARFISMFPQPDGFDTKKLTDVDKWVLSELNQLVERIIPECDKLDFHKPAVEIRSFTWNLFADHVLEMLKGRAFNSDGAFTEIEQKSAWYVLHTSLNTLLRTMAPITPFITDSIYRQLYNPEGIHNELFPTPNKSWTSDLVEYTDLLQRTNSGFWKFKRENGLSLRTGLPLAYVSSDLKQWSSDLKAMHGIEELEFGIPKDKDLIEVTLPESEDVIYIKAPEETKE
jgi:valyl-tRNA synthetase